MQTAVDQQTISCMNQSLVLNLIKEKKRITRAGISQALKLSPPSVSANIEKLLKKGVILEYEIDSACKRPGRKGTLIGLNPYFFYTVTISLSSPELRVALGNACEEMIDYQQYGSLEGCAGSDVINAIIFAVNDMLARNHIEMSKVGMIVVCSPGVIDNKMGKIEFAPQISGWEQLNIVSALEKQLAAKTLIINDINAAALGELMYGIGLKNKSFVYISIDRGIGAGIVINGDLIQGAHSAAGEVGYMLTSVEQLNSKPQFGHLESLISIQAIFSNIARRLGISETELNIDKINSLYKDNNFVVCQEIEYISKLLAMSIINITAVLNTPIVCIGGRISEFQVNLVQHISQYIQDMVPYPPVICMSDMGSKGFIPGALHLGTDKILNDIVNTV